MNKVLLYFVVVSVFYKDALWLLELLLNTYYVSKSLLAHKYESVVGWLDASSHLLDQLILRNLLLILQKQKTYDIVGWKHVNEVWVHSWQTFTLFNLVYFLVETSLLGYHLDVSNRLLISILFLVFNLILLFVQWFFVFSEHKLQSFCLKSFGPVIGCFWILRSLSILYLICIHTLVKSELGLSQCQFPDIVFCLVRQS